MEKKSDPRPVSFVSELAKPGQPGRFDFSIFSGAVCFSC
jgi:hypothetical protein